MIQWVLSRYTVCGFFIHGQFHYRVDATFGAQLLGAAVIFACSIRVLA
ncbi:hypothetical protein O9992_05875 [Vibrio lentus]|nr:hypothetical protein [Vibrio lentus]